MKTRHFVLCCFVILLASFFGMPMPDAKSAQDQAAPKAEWTLLMYTDADNDPRVGPDGRRQRDAGRREHERTSIS
jgi:hypothetical protein